MSLLFFIYFVNSKKRLYSPYSLDISNIFFPLISSFKNILFKSFFDNSFENIDNIIFKDFTSFSVKNI